MWDGKRVGTVDVRLVENGGGGRSVHWSDQNVNQFLVTLDSPVVPDRIIRLGGSPRRIRKHPFLFAMRSIWIRNSVLPFILRFARLHGASASAHQKPSRGSNDREIAPGLARRHRQAGSLECCSARVRADAGHEHPASMSPRVRWRRDRPRSGRTCLVVFMLVLVSLLVFMLVLVSVFVPMLVMLVVLVVVDFSGLLDLHVLEGVCRLPQFVCG